MNWESRERMYDISCIIFTVVASYWAIQFTKFWWDIVILVFKALIADMVVMNK